MTGETVVSKVRAPNPGPLPRVPPTTSPIRILWAKETMDKEEEEVKEVGTAKEEEHKGVNLVERSR